MKGARNLRVRVVPLFAGISPAFEVCTPSQPRTDLPIRHAPKDAPQHVRVVSCREPHGEPGAPTIMVACGAPVQKRFASQHADIVAAREFSAQPAGIHQCDRDIQHLEGCPAAVAVIARWVTVCRVCHRFLLKMNRMSVSAKPYQNGANAWRVRVKAA